MHPEVKPSRLLNFRSFLRVEFPLLFAIFLDLVGFGMAFPDVQLRAEEFGASGPLIGLLLSSYFIVQIFASPRWGRLSDHIGRKPVLLICTFLSACSMFVYSAAGSIWLILASRMLAGLAAANVVVGQAYVADTSTEENRARRMGYVGAAITAGLIAGPAIGGRLASVGGNQLMGIVAGSASFLSFLWLLIALPSTAPTAERQPGRMPIVDLRILKDILPLRRLFGLASLAWFTFACLEGTFGRLIKLKLGYAQREFGDVYSIESLVGVFAGLSIGWLASRTRPTVILRAGYIMMGAGLLLTPFAGNMAKYLEFAEPLVRSPMLALLLVSAVAAYGIGIANPTLSTLCSNVTPANRQGEMFGLLQAARSLGFVFGPILGGWLFDLQPEAPYFLAGGVALLAALLVAAPSQADRPSTES